MKFDFDMVNCSECNLKLTKNNNGVSCIKCKNFFHQRCAIISDFILNDIISGKLDWKCNNCITTQLNSSNAVHSGSEGDLDIDNVKKSIDLMSAEINNLKLKQNDMTNSLNLLINGLNDIRKISDNVSLNSEKLKILEIENNTLKAEVFSLSQRVDNIESRSLTSYIQIDGFPVIPKNDKLNENLNFIIKQIHQKLNVDVKDNEIVKVYQRSKIINGKSRLIQSIIVQYVNNNIRNKLLIASKTEKNLTIDKLNLNFAKLENNTNKIYFNEFITLNKKKLLYKSRIFKNENNFKFLWVKNGKIYLKKDENSKIFIVKNEHVLNDIKKKLNQVNINNL